MPVSQIWKRVEEIETYHVLSPIPSKELNKGLAALLAPESEYYVQGCLCDLD